MEKSNIDKQIEKLEKLKHSTVSWVKFDKYQDEIDKLKNSQSCKH